MEFLKINCRNIKKYKFTIIWIILKYFIIICFKNKNNNSKNILEMSLKLLHKIYIILKN